MADVQPIVNREHTPIPAGRRPWRIPALLAAAVLTLSACGDDTVEPGAADGTLPPATDAPPTTDSPVDGPGYDHPTGARDVVFEYAEVGGFTTREFAFQRIPAVLVSGDGRVFTPGAQIAIYPGPLLPAIQVQTISEEGIQRLLAAAEDAGLFADVDYRADTNVADATSARVVINAADSSWIHEAYALGFMPPGEAEASPERQALADFLAQLGDLASLVGADELGEPELFQPEQFVVETLVVDDLSAFGSDVEPSVVAWPADASVRPAELLATPGTESCTTVSATEFGELFAGATQLTFFTDGDVTYQVLARPVLPGDACG